MVVTRLEPLGGKDTETRDTQEPARGSQERTSISELPNGLRVILHPSDAVGLVAMAFTTRGGVLLEDEQSNGLGALTTALSTKGAAERSAEQIAEFFGEAGGSVAGKCGNNSFYWQGTVLADRFDEALEIFSDIIIRPTFSEEELEILRPILATRIKQQDERWREQLFKFFRSRFFTRSPYRFLPVGRTNVVAEATTENIRQYHRKHLLGGSSVLAIYGNFNAEKASDRIKKLFADLPPGQTKVAVPDARQVVTEGELHVLNTENRIAGVIVAAPGMKIDDLQDRFAINVLDTIVSGWYLPAGWLHRELRGKELVYVVHAYNWVGLAPGAFCVYAGCQPEKVDQVLQIIKGNLDKAANYLPTQREIDLAVNSILTAELLQNQEMSSLAMSAALDELYGLGHDFRTRIEENYRSVTPQEVQRVGRKYLGRGYVVTVTSPERGRSE
jgi:zinc protease